KAVPGVVSVVTVPSGVAVLGEHFWAAKLGRDALELLWDGGSFASHSTAKQREEFRKLASQKGLTAAEKGDVDAAMARAAKKVESEYEVPYLAHATMEPLNCTVELSPDSCEIWTG